MSESAGGEEGEEVEEVGQPESGGESTVTSAEGAEAPETTESTEREPWRLWDHIGVLSGWAIGLIFVALLALLAVAGDPAALAILVTLVIGVAMIILGLKLRGPRR